MYVLTAIALGFLGSFHCIGMCGPIALVIPMQKTSPFYMVLNGVIYNLGRIVTYTIIGLLFGFVGLSFAIAGWQSVVSIMLGFLILLTLFIPRLLQFLPSSKIYILWITHLKHAIVQLFNAKTTFSLFLIGILNGMLPCGLVYIAIAGSLATGSVLKAALFMTLFGLGTMPVMFILLFARNLITISLRERIKKLVPIVLAITAILLILRGMNLNIPYISPQLQVSGNNCHYNCCNK